MEREKLFRGKKTDNGEWVCGDLLQDVESGICAIVSYVNLGGNIHDLSESCIFAVIPETVGMFTRLTDKSGTKIFEGDIAKGIAYSATKTGVIVWIDEISSFGVRYVNAQNPTAWENSSILRCISMGKTDEFAAEVIGNIYDTPQLLKEAAKDIAADAAQSGFAPRNQKF